MEMRLEHVKDRKQGKLDDAYGDDGRRLEERSIDELVDLFGPKSNFVFEGSSGQDGSRGAAKAAGTEPTEGAASTGDDTTAAQADGGAEDTTMGQDS